MTDLAATRILVIERQMPIRPKSLALTQGALIRVAGERRLSAGRRPRSIPHQAVAHWNGMVGTRCWRSSLASSLAIIGIPPAET